MNHNSVPVLVFRSRRLGVLKETGPVRKGMKLGVGCRLFKRCRGRWRGIRIGCHRSSDSAEHGDWSNLSTGPLMGGHSLLGRWV